MVNEAATAYWRRRKLPAAVVGRLRRGPPAFPDADAWQARLRELGVVRPRHMRIATEGALLGSLVAHGASPELAVLSDGAGQYDVLTHAACWIHAERPLARMIPYSEPHRAAVETTRDRIWTLYQDLKDYRRRPEPTRRAALEARFDELCGQRKEIRDIKSVLHDFVFPGAEGRHESTGRSACSELNFGIYPLHDFRSLFRDAAILARGFRQICHGPSISLPRHQNFTACGSLYPCATRRSLRRVPPGWLQYSRYSRASLGRRFPRFTPSIGSVWASLHHSINSFVPNALVSVLNQARSSRLGLKLNRTYALLPIVARNEIASRVTNNRGTKFSNQLEYVTPEPVMVGCRVARLKNAGVNASAQVFNE